MTHATADAALDAAEPFEPEADGVAAEDDGQPKGFQHRDAAGIYRWEEGREEGKGDWVWLCSPLTVRALPRDEIGKGWGRLVEVVDPDGRAHRWAIPARLFAGDGSEIRGGLLNLGLHHASGPKARHALHDLLMHWRQRRRVVSSERMGWATSDCRAFVLGGDRVLGDEDVVFQSDAPCGPGEEIREQGTVEDWRAKVGAPCRGNPILIAGVSLAFAGPLLELLGIEGGGLHLRGASSRGKSTAQRLAVSVWGSPNFLLAWRATTNGLEGVAAACNGTLMALDEMGEIDGREAGKAAYMLANGVGKARANRSGGSRPSLRWRVALLSSGEISLADKMAEGGERIKAGQEIRLLDIIADRQKHGAFDDLHGHASAAGFADAANSAASQTFGTAGPRFVEHLLTDLDGHRRTIRDGIEAFQQMAEERSGIGDADGQVKRAVRRLGLIAAAGEAATVFGITGWATGDASDAMLIILEIWLAERGGAGAGEAAEAIRRTREFISRHENSRFEPLRADGEGGPERIVNRAGWRDGEKVYISTDIWSSEIHRGSDGRRAARHLEAAGYLITDTGGRLTRKLPRGADSRPNTYCVPLSILGAGDE